MTPEEKAEKYAKQFTGAEDIESAYISRKCGYFVGYHAALESDEVKEMAKALDFYSNKDNFQYDMPIEFNNEVGTDAPPLGTMAKKTLAQFEKVTKR